MIGGLVLIAVVITVLIYIAYDDFDPPDDGNAVVTSSPDACAPNDGLCCGGGCHV